MWCDILNNSKQGAPYRWDHIYLMNVPMYYDDKVEGKATHPKLLDTKKEDDILVPPCNRNITKTDQKSGLQEVRWDLAQVPL